MPPDGPASPTTRLLPQPVETTQKARRRFAPEPVEQSARSNLKGKDGEGDVGDAGETTSEPRVRRFLPKPIETSTKHSHSHPAVEDNDDGSGTSSPHRALPQPVDSSRTSSKARKFAPQLMDTSRRSRKRTDTLPAVLPSDRGDEYQPHELLHIPKHLRPSPTPPVNSPIASSEHVPQLHESRFSAANLARRETRRHSFRVPDLPRIASSGSEEDSKVPSFSNSPAVTVKEAPLYKHATRVRESVDDRSSGYLLALAARTAEKQLREQVLAGFPNEHDHEPVDHFAVDVDSDSSEAEGTGVLGQGSSSKATPHKRESAAGWDASEMRQHREKLRQQKDDYKKGENGELDRRRAGFNPFTQAGIADDFTKATTNEQKGPDKQEWQAMRKAASPPMAGAELQFPQCLSPKETLLDVGSYPLSAKLARTRSPPAEHSGLWTPGGGASRQASHSGLWMGVCALSVQQAQTSPKVIQSGLLTPENERDDPFNNTLEANQQLPPSPPSSFESKSEGLDSILQRERTIEEEFDDAFVTQIYNYLSMGYPALAQKFDYELSKITKIPVEQLRRNDSSPNVKGYVGAPEGTGSDMRGMQDGQCERWIALRLYVREWARQHPHMLSRDDGPNKDWGARARKGSWAL